MSETQVRDEAMTLLLAGHETTANALSWTLFLLSENPDAGANLRAEVSSILAGRPPCYEDVERLPYTRMVFEESMRLYPPAWAVTRAALDDDVIGGYRIDRGAGILISPWVLHRDPRFWEEPKRFVPERFTPERIAERPRHVYLPFSAGPRNCIGQAFAMLEGILVLATLASRVVPRLVTGHTVTPDPVFTLRPLGGLPMTLDRVGSAGDWDGRVV